MTPTPVCAGFDRSHRGRLGAGTILFLLNVAMPASEQSMVDFHSIVQLTYENNLEVAASRHEMESAELQLEHFERNLSQFRPLIVESGLESSGESFLRNDQRVAERENTTEMSAGMEKEFFGGGEVAARTGVRTVHDRDSRSRSPFVGVEARFPLFSSFTRLERITERSFEEGEMLGAWLDFIDTVQESIRGSQEAYVELQLHLARRDIAAAAHRDISALLGKSGTGARDASLLQDQLQAYHSRIVEPEGEIVASRIKLQNRLGLDLLRPETIQTVDLYAEDFYGAGYFRRPAEELVAEALASDVEMRVLQIARDNAQLKRNLAKQGKWDIIARVFGDYDFEAGGGHPSARRNYRAGVGFSVQRNDPKLLRLSLRRAEAEERTYVAKLEFRRREVVNAIRQRLAQAAGLRDAVRELRASRELRRSVFVDMQNAYLKGEETLDHLLQARSQLFGTERDLLSNMEDFHEIILDLDEASGAYFRQLGVATKRFQLIGNASVPK